MASEFIAYIDEAGDEGFGKLRNADSTGQSRWLLVGAAIVSKENDQRLPAWRDEIVALFPRKQNPHLHFRNLNHSQRVAVCQYLSQKQIGISVVASNKITIPDLDNVSVFKRKGHLYNYLMRFLLERITDACKSAAQSHGDGLSSLKVVFSRRGGTDYQSMRDYLMLMRDGREVMQPTRSINWSVLDLDAIQVENHSKRAGLQIADILTSATSAGLEPNNFGNTEPRYALILRERFISHKGCVLNSGLTLIPPPRKGPLSNEQQKFLIDIEKKVRAPGS